MHKRRLTFVALVAAVVLSLGLVPTSAFAANEDKDILLGAFFTSEEDVTDTIYASYGGSTFYAIDTPYRDATPTDASSLIYNGNHSTHKCPGICYYNGYFWMISNWNRNDGRFHPMLSYSKDLVHWTNPEGVFFNDASTNNGIAVDVAPSHDGANFDVVAPKMHVTNDGLYITFCAGHFSGFRGEALGQADRMQVYTCKVTELSATDGTDAGNGYLTPHITFRAETAKKVTAPDVENTDDAEIIDSNFYTEGDTTYLLLKRNGNNEEIYKSSTPNDPGSWVAVNKSASVGYEGMCIAKANGIYYLFGDGVINQRSLGIRCVTSSSIDTSSTWRDGLSTADDALRAAGTIPETDTLHPVAFIGENGQSMPTRHGDVITLKAGTPEWRLVKSKLDQRLGLVTEREVYRLYNPYDYYRMYTTDTAEYEHLVSLGWNGEGIAWEAPSKSNSPVYRLYNPYSGDHLWTVDANEYARLAGLGWRQEGVGLYSDDAKGVEIRRYFNQWITERGSTHHYTASAEEQSTMLTDGWLWDGEGSSIYGLKPSA